MKEVTLFEILNAREKRAQMQKELIDRFNLPLICFTMNIAGPVKTSLLTERAFEEGINLLESRIKEFKVSHRYKNISHTGCVYMVCVDKDAKELKNICTDIEESSFLGRLFDMDVLTADGTKLSRKNERNCLICGAHGRVCAAGRLHSVEELQKKTKKIITDYFFEKDAVFISDIATKALIDEVCTTPKPGLVDMRNNGSHKDMDVPLFKKSANSLTPYFKSCFLIGASSKDKTFDETFSLLKKEGIKAEQTMYNATDGINTHKGVIYSFGVICGALGRLWKAESICFDASEIFNVCSAMTIKACEKDFATIDSSTAGGRLFLENGLKGIRGEVMNGFPCVLNISLPVYENAVSNGLTRNDAGVLALCHLIYSADDTNLYHRGGKEGAEYAKDSVYQLLKGNIFPEKEKVEQLDDEFIKRNLSPGGCADLLAVTYFIYDITRRTT